jgi:hypothetical protein
MTWLEQLNSPCAIIWMAHKGIAERDMATSMNKRKATQG